MESCHLRDRRAAVQLSHRELLERRMCNQPKPIPALKPPRNPPTRLRFTTFPSLTTNQIAPEITF